MCRICVEWELGKLTTKEAFKNLGEALNTTESKDEKDHLFELSNRLLDTEVPYSEDKDDEMDVIWHKENYEE